MHVFCGLGIILAKVVTYTSQPPAKQKMGRKRRDGQYPFIKTPQC